MTMMQISLSQVTPNIIDVLSIKHYTQNQSLLGDLI